MNYTLSGKHRRLVLQDVIVTGAVSLTPRRVTKTQALASGKSHVIVGRINGRGASWMIRPCNSCRRCFIYEVSCVQSLTSSRGGKRRSRDKLVEYY